ncbi:decaprenyl-diphosphate synthase subunit 2-like [Limulus polyphemus]|uniref:Decaprenyl-diphosphate synthase subunit 2-like n=1 Tax=Limulus polyphemus TaxID=6850 RepID=A0ABM1B841_LIMPO|nr:decaprenyl-diphosphate synthase subunit 2-like [Limulus polyphemus]
MKFIAKEIRGLCNMLVKERKMFSKVIPLLNWPRQMTCTAGPCISIDIKPNFITSSKIELAKHTRQFHHRFYASLGSYTTKTSDWNRAVSDAEKIVGYPTSYFSLRCLLSDEISNIALHLRKLIGTNHPILKTAKRLIYNGRNNMQTRGLIVLLVSKAVGHHTSSRDYLEASRSAGISQRQRSLAEITEMIHTAHLIHRGMLNLSESAVPDSNTLKDLQFGNKISVLSGDYLLANACKGLAELRNCTAVDLISTAIGDFMQAEFVGEHDSEGNALPTASMGVADWEQRSFLWAGSLMANSCKATLELAGHNQEVQERGYEFGKVIGLAWQTHADLQPFTDTYRHPPGTMFDLTSVPVLLCLENEPKLLDYIRSCGASVTSLDFKKLHTTVIESGAVEKAKKLLSTYTKRAQVILAEFGNSDATLALLKIVHALEEQ